MEAYRDTLTGLLADRVDFALIGTYALKCYLPEQMHDYVLDDCDLVLAPDFPNIRRSVHSLQRQGWVLTVWEEALPEALDAAFFKGKFYLRARKAALRIDLTYECPWIPWEEMARDRIEQNGLPLASVQHILLLKRQKGLPKDLAWADKVEAWISGMKGM